MTTENPSPREPLEDQPPPKQYAPRDPRQEGEQGTDERSGEDGARQTDGSRTTELG